MKKLFFTMLFGFGFMLVGFAHQNTSQQPNFTTQKGEKARQNASPKYDFSLFKFVTPTEVKADSSTTKKEEVLIEKKSKDDTRYLFEKPQAFLLFS